MIEPAVLSWTILLIVFSAFPTFYDFMQFETEEEIFMANATTM